MRALIVLLFSSQLAFAQQPAPDAYIPADLASVLVPAESGSGRGPAVDLEKLDVQIDGLARHAKKYPPTFASEADKQLATTDAQKLIGILDILNAPGESNIDLLRRAGFVCSMAHNLDVPGAGQKAAHYFSKLLETAPNDPQGNYLFGAFLGGAGKPDAALPFLLKADSLGVANAPYALGIAYLMLGNKQKAIESLERYQKLAPEDRSIDPLLAAIRAGKVESRNAPGTQ